MEQDKMYRIWRGFLIVLNIIFEVCGIIAIFIGFYLLVGSSHIHSVTAAVLFVAGALVVIISMLGYVGAHKENPKLLKIYAGIVICLLVLKVAAFIYLLFVPVHHPKDSDFKILYEYYGKDITATTTLDKIQSGYYCCGYDGPHSLKKSDGTYPTSCCTKSQTTCFIPYAEGCASKVLGTLNPFLVASKVSSYVSFVLHILCVFGAFYMSNAIEEKARAPKNFQYGNL